LVRERVFYRKQNKSVANHTYAQLFGKGIPYEEGVLTRPRRRESLRELGIPEVDRGLDRLEDLSETTRELDKAIHAAFVESKEAKLLETIPGIGGLTAVILVAFPCPIVRFRTFDQLSSYCGLCPTNHQSANHSFRGSLKPDCNHLLRWVLVEAGWSHRRASRSSYVARVGRRNGRRKGTKRGAIDTAHALLRVVYAILKRGTPYLPHAPERPSCSESTARSPRPSHD
jgi:transposase